MEERQLINECLKNKREAQHELYRRFSGKFLAVLVRYTKNKEEAEDVLHDGFIKIFANLHKYNYAGSFEGWARRIVVNCVLDYIRSKKEFSFSSCDLECKDIEQVDDDNYEYLRGIPSEIVFKTIGELPIGYRTIFNMRVLDGFTCREAALKLNISEGYVKSSYSRGRARIQKKLKEYYEGRVEHTVIS